MYHLTLARCVWYTICVGGLPVETSVFLEELGRGFAILDNKKTAPHFGTESLHGKRRSFSLYSAFRRHAVRALYITSLLLSKRLFGGKIRNSVLNDRGTILFWDEREDQLVTMGTLRLYLPSRIYHNLGNL